MLACENNLSCPSRDLVDPYLCTTLENVPIRRVIEFTGILRAGLISEKVEKTSVYFSILRGPRK